MKLVPATILLLTAFTANANSNVAPIYPPALENGFLSLAINDNQGSVLVYAPSIIWIEGVDSQGQTVATLHMIEGNTVKTVVRLSTLKGLLNAKPDKSNE